MVSKRKTHLQRESSTHCSHFLWEAVESLCLEIFQARFNKAMSILFLSQPDAFKSEFPTFHCCAIKGKCNFHLTLRCTYLWRYAIFSRNFMRLELWFRSDSKACGRMSNISVCLYMHIPICMCICICIYIFGALLTKFQLWKILFNR